MSGTTNRKKVLAIGLKSVPNPKSSREEEGAFLWPAEVVVAGIKEQTQRAARAGFDIHAYLVNQTEKTDETTVDEIRAELRRENWDGVSVGFGVRGDEELTPLFERIMNAIVEEVRPPPKLIFSVNPTTVWIATARVFGVDAT